MSLPASPLNAASQKNNADCSNSRLATQLYWLTGLAPIATNVVTPLMVFWQLRRGNKAPMVKYNQQVNEVGRQFVSGTIGLVSYFGGGEVTRGILKGLNGIGFNVGQPVCQQNGQNPDDSGQKVAMLLGGILMSFVGFAVIRPWVSTQLICKFLKKEAGVEVALTEPQYQTIKAETHTRPELVGRIEKQLAEMAKADSGKAVDGFPIQQIQRWVDKNLFTSSGDPKLAKTAGVATLALTGWLTGLTGILYGLNQALGGHKAMDHLNPTLPAKPANGSGFSAFSQSPQANLYGQYSPAGTVFPAASPVNALPARFNNQPYAPSPFRVGLR